MYDILVKQCGILMTMVAVIIKSQLQLLSYYTQVQGQTRNTKTIVK